MVFMTYREPLRSSMTVGVPVTRGQSVWRSSPAREGKDRPGIRLVHGAHRNRTQMIGSALLSDEDLVEKLDEEYFDAREAAEAAGQDEETWHARFHRARAAAAVLFASEEDPLFAAAEASDEARVASHDDTVGLRQVIEAALS